MTAHLRATRPVGNSIALHREWDAPLIGGLLDCDHYDVTWTDSGTAALALALTRAKAASAIMKPEVILPAYGCPDLIAAALFAQVQPVLVDIQADSPTFDYAELDAAINSNTIAIVAATLLGMRADATRLRAAIGDRPIALIEDSAQWFPRDRSQTFFGDYVVLSFGRGKPVNLLGGGALLTRNNAAHTDRFPQPARESSSERARYLLKGIAYNLLINPLPYGLLERIPALQLGATHFHALGNIGNLPPSAQRVMTGNLRRYCARNLHVQRQWRDIFANLKSNCAISLAEHNRVPSDYALLRYPVAIYNGDRRNRIYSALRAQGLGASLLYPAPLPELPDVPIAACRISNYPNAKKFAQTFLTLPTHAAVAPAIIEKSRAIIQRLCSD